MVSAVMKTSLGDLKGRVQAPGSVTDPENLNNVDPSRRHVLYDVMYQLHHYLCWRRKHEAKKLRVVFVKRRLLELQLWSKGSRFLYFHTHVLSDCDLKCKLVLNEHTDLLSRFVPMAVCLHVTVSLPLWNRRCPRGDSQATVYLQW